MQQPKTTIEISRVQKREGNHCKSIHASEISIKFGLGLHPHSLQWLSVCVSDPFAISSSPHDATSQWLQPWQLNKTLCRCARNTLPSPKVPPRPDRNLRSSKDSQGFQRNISNLFQASQHRNTEEQSSNP